MDKKLELFLYEWAKPYVHDEDLAVLFLGEEQRRYDAIKLAKKKQILLPIRRGLYQIGKPFSKTNCEPFELAQAIYGPSYISLESALSFHGWIPEAVYTTTSVCSKRSKEVKTPLGVFRYSHTPTSHFFLNVERVVTEQDKNNSSIFLVAEPWKAVADAIYCYKRCWKSIFDLATDFRIEIETMKQSDHKSLFHIAEYYESDRVQKTLYIFLKELL